MLNTFSMHLSDAAAKRTKENRTIFSRWNAKVRKLLEDRSAVLVAEHKEDADSIIGYDYFRFELETEAGKLSVIPSGNWLACRFEDPDRAAAFLRARPWMPSHNLNTYSGKWNFHYFGTEFDESLIAVRELLDGVITRRTS
jgi:hypothetical protein